MPLHWLRLAIKTAEIGRNQLGCYSASVLDVITTEFNFKNEVFSLSYFWGFDEAFSIKSHAFLVDSSYPPECVATQHMFVRPTNIGWVKRKGWTKGHDCLNRSHPSSDRHTGILGGGAYNTVNFLFSYFYTYGSLIKFAHNKVKLFPCNVYRVCSCMASPSS